MGTCERIFRGALPSNRRLFLLEIIAYQKLFCAITLLASSARIQRRRTETRKSGKL